MSPSDPRPCAACGQPIPTERLEVLPDTRHCTGCVDRHGPRRVIDPNEVCARASASSQNGFAPKD